MALDDGAYVVGARGSVYLAPVEDAATIPTVADLDAPPARFTEVGHVGNADGDGWPAWVGDGGDVTTLGSWAKQAVRTMSEPLSESIEFALSQLDDTSLRLYTGADGGDVAEQFAVYGNEVGTAIEHALLIVIRDGATRVGFYAPRVSITRADNIEVPNDGPVMLPLRASLLDNDDDPRYVWIASHLNPAPEEV